MILWEGDEAMALEHPVLLTGGASGVGEATANLLLERGHRVVCLDVKPVAADLQYIQCDLGDPASIDAALADLDGSFSSLLNVAGVPGTVGSELTMKVNFFGLRYLTEQIWDRLADGGTVVSVSSIAGNNWRKRRALLSDMLGTRDNQRNFLDPAPIDFNFDFNRDARVNALDMLIARDNTTHFLNALKLIDAPAESGPPDRSADLHWLHEFEQTAPRKRTSVGWAPPTDYRR